jgi:xylulokinase
LRNGTYIISHDVGTGGNKAVLSDTSGRIIGSSFAPYDVSYPHPSWAEQNPLDWWHAIITTTKVLLKRHKVRADDVMGISLASQMIGTLPVDKYGRPLRPCMIWLDSRSEAQFELLKRKMGIEKIYRTSGVVLSSKECIAKILWLRQKEPNVYSKAHKILDVKDFLLFQLTGNYSTDWTCASLQSLFDLRRKRWSDELAAEIDLSVDMLPDAYPSISVIGEVTANAAKATGLHRGTPVVAGAGDIPSATVGSGAVKNRSAHIYIGTSGWLSITSKKLAMDPRKRFFYCCHPDPERYLIIGETETAGGCYKWFRDEFCKIETERAHQAGSSVYGLMNAKVEKVEPGAKGLLFLPYLYGERSPTMNPHARGAFVGILLTHKRFDLARSILEGVACNIRWIIEAAEESHFALKDLIMIGGGALARTWPQIMSDVTQRRLKLTGWPLDAGAMGAALIAKVGLGFHRNLDRAVEEVSYADEIVPDPAKRVVYSQVYHCFRNSYDQIVPTFEMLHHIFSK